MAFDMDDIVDYYFGGLRGDFSGTTSGTGKMQRKQLKHTNKKKNNVLHIFPANDINENGLSAVVGIESSKQTKENHEKYIKKNIKKK